MGIREFLQAFTVIALASSSGFVVHVATVEWLPAWVSSRMEGHTVMPSWDVRYLAALTAVEIGVAVMVLYRLCRPSLLRFSLPARTLLFIALMLATRGLLVRQPLMDAAIGNPIDVVAVQNLAKWLVWVLTAGVTVLGSEWLVARRRPDGSNTNSP